MTRAAGRRCHALSFRYGQRHHRAVSGDARRRGAGRRVAHRRRPRPARHRRLGADGGYRGPQGAQRGRDRQRHTRHLRSRAQHDLHGVRDRAGRGARGSEIVVGVNVLDSSGYPDCRPEWLAAMQEVARLGTKAGVERRPVTIRAPLIKMSKAEIIRAGVKLGIDYGLTHRVTTRRRRARRAAPATRASCAAAASRPPTCLTRPGTRLRRSTLRRGVSGPVGCPFVLRSKAWNRRAEQLTLTRDDRGDTGSRLPGQRFTPRELIA